MVMSRLLNSMTNEIGEDYPYYETAKEIQDAIKESYSDKENTSELFEVITVTQYFNALNKYWQHLDLFDESELGCIDCSKKHKQIVKKGKLFKFFFFALTKIQMKSEEGFQATNLS